MLTTEKAQERFNTLILPNRGLLLAHARRLSGDNRAEAEDLVQETLVRAFIHINRITCDATVTAWLCTILRNLYINRYNQKIRAVQSVSLQGNEETLQPIRDQRPAGPELVLMRRLQYQAALSALANLPEGYREPVLLADVEGFSYQAVSDQLNLPLGTVRSRIARGRRRIRRLLYSWDCQER